MTDQVQIWRSSKGPKGSRLMTGYMAPGYSTLILRGTGEMMNIPTTGIE